MQRKLDEEARERDIKVRLKGGRQGADGEERLQLTGQGRPGQPRDRWPDGQMAEQLPAGLNLLSSTSLSDWLTAHP
jgi:hypothetical protein